MKNLISYKRTSREFKNADFIVCQDSLNFLIKSVTLLIVFVCHYLYIFPVIMWHTVDSKDQSFILIYFYMISLICFCLTSTYVQSRTYFYLITGIISIKKPWYDFIYEYSQNHIFTSKLENVKIIQSWNQGWNRVVYRIGDYNLLLCVMYIQIIH